MASDPGLPFEELFIGRLKLEPWMAIAIGSIIAGSYIMINQIIAPWIERKVMARMQGRRGPVHVGKWGFLQIPADLLKMIGKEDTRPEGADKFGFSLAIFLTGTTAILSFAPLPWGSKGLIPGNFSIGILYVFAVFSIFPPAMLVGGWASNSKYSLIGGFRSAGQLIAYEIPMFVSILGVIAVVGSFSLVEITNYQMNNGWFIGKYYGAGLIAGLIFFISGVAETERVPFDIPEAEAELVMGPRTEFSGWRYALLMMTEYLHLFINSLLFLYLFVGGYDIWPVRVNNSPSFINDFRMNPFVQFLAITLKVYVLVFVAAWMRSALARLRIDQLLSLGWKYMLPVSILTLVVFLGSKDVFGFLIFW
ncbi:MAG: NADH-quinone oxidoreductase subunit H [Candidatus Heimdallarchaeota archaeon]|nr:NADH-quinone oxidoreductase subunit H [Candidatus Heimdallarchaeota archaeon]MDH5645464.1 NADH-quinone oxidoreductase subunit H [Candidatus Heimdallarchaeota archaeon]